MNLCSHCNAQFSEEHSRCIHCGRKIAAASQPVSELETGPGAAPDVSRLHHLADEHPAKVGPLLDSLIEAVIRFTLITDSGTPTVDVHRGSSGWRATASVYVEPSDRDAAERHYRNFLERLIPHLAQMTPESDSSGESCPACTTPLVGYFESCPSCGLVFPES